MTHISIDTVVKLMMKMSDEEKVETLQFAINKESEKRYEAMQNAIERYAMMTNDRLGGLEFMIESCLIRYGEDNVSIDMFADLTTTVLSVIKDVKASGDKVLWGDTK